MGIASGKGASLAALQRRISPSCTRFFTFIGSYPKSVKGFRRLESMNLQPGASSAVLPWLCDSVFLDRESLRAKDGFSGDLADPSEGRTLIHANGATV
jgi:hypothetical protein